jgi:hypothetical protein
VNYNVVGTYTVEQVGEDTFKARGMFSTRFVGRPARCAATSLQNVPFSIVGTLAAGLADSFTITTDGVGEGSSYAEGEPRGSTTTCTADILNFITSGTGRKFRK